MVAVAPPPSSNHSSGFHDDNARAYLQSLQAGQRPDIKPEFGPRWAPVVTFFEKRLSTVERPEAIAPHLFKSVLKSEKFPGLAELLSGVSRQATPGQSVFTNDPDIPALPEEIQLPPALAQQGCEWLAEYAAYSEQASPEGYKDFHEDCGLLTLAAVSGRRVRLPIGQGQYTPLMIALVAKPGAYAKSTTAEVFPSVMRAAGLDWLLGSDETTPQKLLTDMAGDHIPKQYARFDEWKKYLFEKRQAMAAQVAWYCDEFGELVKSINKPTGPMADLKKLILKFDNCPPAYTTSTQSRGREEISKPFLSFLGVMTPASIKKSAQSQSEEWGDGFWSRFVFSCAPDDDGIDKPFDGETPVPPALSEPLKKYHDWLGEPEIQIVEILDKKEEQVIDYQINHIKPLPEVVIDHKPVEMYWIRYRSALKKLLKDVPEDLKASYLRLPTRALRVAALFASFEGLKSIELRHWAKAQEISERWRLNLHRFYFQVNTSEIATTLSRTVEDKILALVEKQCAKDAPPNLRDLTRYIKGPSSGMLKTAVIDLVRVELLKEEKSGKTTRYFPAEPDG